MALPETIRVKISSENAGYVSVTAVVARDMPLRELIEMMLGVTGKEVGRVHELLLRGALVSGASRFRWTGWEADPAELDALLATFPDPQPARTFARHACIRAVLKGAACRVEVPREVGARKRFLRRTSFWDVLMELAAAGEPRYIEYSYRERADCYRIAVSPAAAGSLRRGAGTAAYSSLEQQIRQGAFDAIEFYVARE